jgi:hypothetical protein
LPVCCSSFESTILLKQTLPKPGFTMKTNTHSKSNTTSAESAKVIRGGLLMAILIVKKIIIPISSFSVNELIDVLSRF